MLAAVENFRLPFLSTPSQIKPPNSFIFSKTEIPHAEKAIHKLLKIGAIIKVEPDSVQFISRIFLVPKKEPDSYRLVINLKKLNEFVISPHFKMENYKSVLTLIEKNCYMASIDLVDAYHAIPVHPDDQKFLRFEYNGKLFQFTCLPFGISCGPRLFTKILRPVMALLRNQRHISNQYLDDLLLIGKTKVACLQNVRSTRMLLKSLGFAISQKSKLTPAMKIEYLGLLYDSEIMRVSLPERKIDKITKLINKVLPRASISIKDLAGLIGNLVAACPGVAYGSIYTRGLEAIRNLALIESNGNFRGRCTLNSECILDLQWWLNKLPNPYNHIRSDQFALTLTTDSSKTGWGAHTESGVTRGFWSEAERHLHINTLELIAVLNGLKSLCNTASHCTILIRCDNTTTIAYINKFGGCRSEINLEWAKVLWRWCEEREVWLFASYIKSSDNWLADKKSREKLDESDFSLDDGSFNNICSKFGQPDIDLFATSLSAKCRRFASWFPDPASEVVDAFTIKWDNYFYAFPPFSQISRVLKKIKTDQATGIVVVPDWCSQIWFPHFSLLLASEILVMKPQSYDLRSPYTNSSHPLCRKMNLLVAVLCGKDRNYLRT